MPTDKPSAATLAANPADVAARRALRLSLGTATCLAVSFGCQWQIPMVAPAMAVFLFASLPRPLAPKAAIGLALVMMLATGSGLLLIPFLRHAATSGVMMTGLCLFLAFRHGLRGGNPLVATFLAAGIMLISAAGVASTALALSVIGALVSGLLLGVAVHGMSYWLIPEPGRAQVAARAPSRATETGDAVDANWMAWRATVVVMPAFVLALTDPAGYLPIVMKAVSLGRQSCATARGAALEIIACTLVGGALAVACWLALGLFVHLWMFFLWMLLFGLLVARRLFGLRATVGSSGFWLHSLVTMIILLGQSVEDSAAGKDVVHAFVVRMGLFTGVSLYACAMLLLLDLRRLPPPRTAR